MDLDADGDGDFTATPAANALYGFEMLVDSLGGTTGPYNDTCQSPLRTNDMPISTSTCPTTLASGSFGLSRSQVSRLGLDDASAEMSSHDMLKTDIKELRSKVQTLDNRLMMAEGRAKKAENEAALWRGNYEQLKKRIEDGGGE